MEKDKASALENKDFGFEEAMAELQKNAALIREGSLSLEKSLEVYDKSIMYYNFCVKYLEEAKQKLEIYNPDTGKTEEVSEKE